MLSKPVTTPCNNCKKAFGSMQLNHIPTVSLKEQTSSCRIQRTT